MKAPEEPDEPAIDRRDVWIFAAIFIPLVIFGVAAPRGLWINHGPRTSPVNVCVNNLRQIDGAKQQWAYETKAATNTTPVWKDIQPYLGRGTSGTIPKCPLGGVYTINSLTNFPTCSIAGHVLN